MILRMETDRARWNRAILALPQAHVLQSWEWGAVKAQTGWQASRLVWPQGQDDQVLAAASLLTRRINGLPWGVAYVPKGPLLDWTDQAAVEQVLAHMEAYARRRRVLFVKIDPDVSPDTAAGQGLVQCLGARGWRPSAEQIQFRNTALLNLVPDEDTLLAAMKPKWRYNIRLAQRRGVEVRQGSRADLEAFYALYRETGLRDGFIVRPFDYYQRTWYTFMEPADAEAPVAHLLLAEVDGTLVAGLILFRFGATAWYMFGASSSCERQRMPNHLLQWEAVRLARSHSCTTYDLWGAPDVLDESDALWGVWRFKEGFGAAFQPHIGAWDYPVQPVLYHGYTGLMPRVLDWMRSRH